MSGFFWLASYPKSGNTWVRAFLRNYMTDPSASVSINDLHTGFSAGDRAWLDTTCGLNTLDLSDDELDCLRPWVYSWYAENSSATTFHKTHDAYGTATSGKPVLNAPGIDGAVYILRNPLDVAQSLADYLGSTDKDAVDLMCNPKASICPTEAYYGPVRQKLGTWSQHVTSWQEAVDMRTIIIRYEDLITAPFDTFSKVVRFSELEYEEEKVERSMRFSHFSVLKEQEKSEGFMEMHADRPFFRSGPARRTADKLTGDLRAKLISHHKTIMKKFGYF